MKGSVQALRRIAETSAPTSVRDLVDRNITSTTNASNHIENLVSKLRRIAQDLEGKGYGFKETQVQWLDKDETKSINNEVKAIEDSVKEITSLAKRMLPIVGKIDKSVDSLRTIVDNH